MKISEFLLAFLLGYLVSSMFVIFLGEHGLDAFRKLEQEKEILLNNINELRNTQLFLNEKLERLKDGTDLLKVMSRQLGYIDKSKDEKLYLLEGYKAGYIQYNPGKMIYFKNTKPDTNFFLRILGFLIGFMVYTIILVCVRIAENGAKHKRSGVVSQNDSVLNQE